MNPLRTPEDYELFLYTLPENYAFINRSTVAFVRMGATLARVTGEIECRASFRLILRERLIYSRLPAVIDWYSYEIWRGAEKLFWYDPQPHPNDPTLQSTHPHHKHIPPDIKHHRIPAPGFSFTAPNLSLVLDEVANLIAVA